MANRNFKFDWILQINPNGLWVVLLFIPPVFYYWIYRIARLGEIISGKQRNWIFTILLLIWTIFFCLLCVDLLLSNSFLSNVGSSGVWQVCILILLFGWFYIDYYVSRITFKIQQLQHKNFTPSLSDFIFRFLLINTGVLAFCIFYPIIMKAPLKEISIGTNNLRK